MQGAVKGEGSSQAPWTGGLWWLPAKPPTHSSDADGGGMAAAVVVQQQHDAQGQRQQEQEQEPALQDCRSPHRDF